MENYGFTKTLVKDKNHKMKHETKWIGDYNGKVANIHYDVNNNGTKESFIMKLDNDDLKQLLGIQPVQIPLEERLSNDFLGYQSMPIVLEGALIKRRTRRHHKRRKHKRSSKTKRRSSKK